MARLNLILLLLVIGTAMFLVHTQYQSRQLYTQLYRAQGEARQLETEFERLQVEKRAQATPLRIEKLAKEQIRMRTTTPAITLYVRGDGSVIPAVAPLSPAEAARQAAIAAQAGRAPSERTPVPPLPAPAANRSPR
ncbi:cell division protein FtsL [Xenophilus arseniciresistens]|uniref:Cell division protein FtsL n=1 Tax=Xenophilus arseniciresistens TaxID=1283306 RepID=A0AAE3T089_9BURK|nr:cell division protein FtsL [Xenophilus arseniciresistens]MDA7417874.1 cell division protein FtsL [Xenophilus arseniciresistens]